MEINKTKKIAIFTTSFLPIIGGLEFELKWLLDSMDKLLDCDKYKKLELFFFAPNKESLKYAEFKNIKTENLNLKPFSKIYLPLNFLKLRKIIKKTKPNILHCQSVTPGGLMVYFNNLISSRNQKYFITSHGNDIAVLPEVNYGVRLNPIINFLTKLILKKAAKHITISRAMGEFAVNAGSERDKIIIIPNGLKPVDKNIDTSIKRQIIKRYYIKKDDFCLLSLSGMRMVKGHQYLIDGFDKAYRKNKHLKLFLACQGLETEKIKKRVKKLNLENNIYFIGFVTGEEKKAFFSICDMYCNTSLFESFGIVLLEAMDYGLVILGSTQGGAKDFIKDGYNGFLCFPKDTGKIAEIIIKVAKDSILRERIKKNTKEIIKKYYIENIAKAYLNLYL